MKLKSAQRKFLRYTVGWFIWPFALIIAPIYKWYRKVVLKRKTEGKIQDIVSGFSYLVVKDSEIEKLAKKRAEICGKCPHAKYSNKVNTIVVGETVHKIKGTHCELCGCSLSAKVRSEDDRCPLRKW